MQIRPAVTEDLAVVARLFRDYAASLDIDLAYQDFAGELASLPGAYAPPAGALLLAVADDGRALGCVAMRPMAEPESCEMKRLHLAPAARGRGIGRALVVAVIGAAQTAGYRTMRLDTLPSMAAAQGLYRSLGFLDTPAYYSSPVAGTRFMALTLRRATLGRATLGHVAPGAAAAGTRSMRAS